MRALKKTLKAYGQFMSILVAPLMSGCIIFFPEYGITDSPTYPMSVTIYYDNRCVGEVVTPKGDTTILDGWAEIGGNAGREQNITCRFIHDRSQPKKNRIDFVYLLIVFDPPLTDPASWYDKESGVKYPYADVRTAVLQGKTEPLELQLSPFKDYPKNKQYVTHSEPKIRYAARLEAKPRGGAWKPPIGFAFSCGGWSIYSKNGQVELRPASQFSEKGVYATISANMVFGGDFCF